jgi:uncharacterized protein YjgD (DUF1641 family)
MATVEVQEDTLHELTSLLMAIKDSATPGLAERITNIMVSLGTVAAEVDPRPASELVAAVMNEAEPLKATLRQLAEWHRTGTWQALTEIASVVAAFKDSVTPHLAERAATITANVGAVAGEVGPGIAQSVAAVERHGDALARMVEDLGRWERDGTWDSLRQVVSLVKALTDSVTPQMLERTLAIVIEGVSALQDAFDSGLLTLGVKMAHALNVAAQAAETDTGRISATALMRRLKEPGVQRGMKVVMAFLRELPSVVNE